MTVQNQVGKAVYVADGNSTSFVIPFYFFNKEISVYVGTNQSAKEEGTDYTITGSGQPSGGAVIFTTAPASGEVVSIVRNVELTQLVKFMEGEIFPASDFEYSLDKMVMALQQLQERLQECVNIPRGLSLTAEETAALLVIINENKANIAEIPTILTAVNNLRTEIMTEFGNYYNKTAVDSMISDVTTLRFSDVNVNVSTAVADATYANYPYHIDVALSGVTDTRVPEVCFGMSEAMSGNFAPVASSYNGGVRIYMKAVPGANFTLASVVMH